MPRTARKQSITGVYHIILRGINKQTVFEEEEDNSKFLDILSEVKDISGFKLYAYCLMGNHAHFLLKEEGEPLGLIFKRIGARYVFWFNMKYDRVGHLFQDRFRSEPVEDERYFAAVLRYIHRNPVKAGLSESPEAYRWSSFSAYLGGKSSVDTEFVLERMTPKQLYEFTREQDDMEIAEYSSSRRTDADISDAINDAFGAKCALIQSMAKQERNALLTSILSTCNVNMRQLSRVTGISYNIISRLNTK